MVITGMTSVSPSPYCSLLTFFCIPMIVLVAVGLQVHPHHTLSGNIYRLGIRVIATDLGLLRPDLLGFLLLGQISEKIDLGAGSDPEFFEGGG